jgi:DNA-binding NtrC family response regulator
MLVDDDPNILTVFQSGLELKGFEVVTASSSQEAMDVASAFEGPLHACVVDINLPDGFGSSLAFGLQQIHPGAKVVYMSGYTTLDPILKQGIEEHMVFLTKPFSIADLASTIRDVVGS